MKGLEINIFSLFSACTSCSFFRFFCPDKEDGNLRWPYKILYIDSLAETVVPAHVASPGAGAEGPGGPGCCPGANPVPGQGMQPGGICLNSLASTQVKLDYSTYMKNVFFLIRFVALILRTDLFISPL